MAKKLEKISNALNILENYKGKNPYIINLKNDVCIFKKKTLTDWEIGYIENNYKTEPQLLNKMVKVSKWFGTIKSEELNLDFTIEKLFITYFIGETPTRYHVYVQYRQSVPPQLWFIPKTELLTPLFECNFLEAQIDFTKYNTDNFTLTPTQERGIKFLTTRKKGILSLEQGLGKSASAVVAAIEQEYKKILVICPASLKTNWKNEIERFDNSENITIVEGSNWNENKWTIINYDILKNFYTVAKETKNVKVKEFTDEGISWTTVQKTTKTNKKSIVDECLSNSQLFQMSFDLIIIDEAHRLSNKTSGMYEIMDDLIKRSHIDSIYALTGTIIKNDPTNLYNILKLVGCDFCQTYQDYSFYLQKYCGAKQIFPNRKERDYYSKKFITAHRKNEWNELTRSEKKELDEYLAKNCRKIWISGEPSNLEELAERIKPYYYREVNDFSNASFNKETKLLEYTLTQEEKRIYNNAWDDYINTHDEKNIDKLIENHKLIESSVFRQVLSEFMIPYTIKLAEEEINNNKKIIIFCAFDKELYSLQEYFGEKCVIYNGKMTPKKKDEALKNFKENDNVKVFIGNIIAASVGLNINEASVVIFQNCSFVPSDNAQAEFRCCRLGQTKNVTIYYQKFKDTYMDRLFEILDVKNNITNTLIKDA